MRRNVHGLAPILAASSCLLLAFCLAADLHVFTWEHEISAADIRAQPQQLFSVELRREPLGLPGVRYMPGDRDGSREGRPHTREGVRLFEDGRELGPPHMPLERLSLGGGRFNYFGRTLHFTSSDGSDPRSNGRRYSVRMPVVADWSLSVAALVACLLCLSWASRAGADAAGSAMARVQSLALGRTALRSRRLPVEELTVFALSVTLAFAYALSQPSLSIPHGPLVAGVGKADARLWDDAAWVFASGAGYSLHHRPGYPILLGSAYALFGVSPGVPIILNFVAFGGTSVLVYKTALHLFGRAAAIGSALLLLTDVVRLNYLQVVNTDTVGCFLFASFVYLALVLFGGRHRSGFLWFLLGLLLGMANLVKTMTLPAVVVVVAWIAASKRVAGASRKLLTAALVVAGLLVPLLPWSLFHYETRATTELTAKGAKGLFIATSPELNIDGNVQRRKSRQILREVGSAHDELVARNLRQHWDTYLRNVVFATHKSFDVLHFGGQGSIFALCVALLLALLARWNDFAAQRGRWLLANGAAFAALTGSLFTLGIWLPAAIVGVGAWQRSDLRMFLLLAATPLVVTSLLGMGGYERQLVAVTWVYPIATAGSLSLLADGLGAALARGRSPETARPRGPAGPPVDPVSLALVTALLAVVGLGALRIAGDVQASGSVGPPLTMKGVQRHALPTHEYERRTAGGKSWRRGSCDPKRAPILVQQARRMLAEGSGSSGRPPELSCARVFTGRHLYRFREGQRGLWNTSRPVFFDRLYQRTLIWEMGLFRIDGLLDDTWHNRVVHIVSAEGLAGVRNVVLLEDAEPADSGARHRESVRAADPRHLDAVRREGASIRRR